MQTGQRGNSRSCAHSPTLRRFTYVTAHSPTLPPLHLRHSSFYNPSVASPVRGTSPSSPGEPPIHSNIEIHLQNYHGPQLWSLYLIQRAPGSIPGQVNYLNSIFLEFFLIRKTNVRNLGHIRPQESLGHHNYLKAYSSIYGRRQSLILVVVHGRR